MIADLFCPFEDDLSQHTLGDIQSSLNIYPFGDADLFCEDFQPFCSDFVTHRVAASPRHFEVHTAKHNYFHIENFGGDLQIKKLCFLSLREDFSSRHKVVPYPISPYLGNQ
jgi:hypothetical protein